MLVDRGVIETLTPANSEVDPGTRDGILIIGAGGANARRMDETIGSLVVDHPVYGVDLHIPDDPKFPIPPQNMYRANDTGDKAEVLGLIESGSIHAVYLNLIPSMHVEQIKTYLGFAARGLIDFLVVPKPAVSGLVERREVDEALKDAIEQRVKLGIEKPDRSSLIYVHEHYIQKSAWHALQEQLGEVSRRLGRLERVTIGIAESATPEAQRRLAALHEGTQLDLIPHLLSMGNGIFDAINETGDYVISDRPTTRTSHYRYEGSKLPEGVETAFVVDGHTSIVDMQDPGVRHELTFSLSGGKGMANQKEAVLTFIHPGTGNRSIIAVDLQENTISVPPELTDLFPDTRFTDNGYGESVLVGLSGKPDLSFQRWTQARRVIGQAHLLEARSRQSDRGLIEYHQGVPLAALGGSALQAA